MQSPAPFEPGAPPHAAAKTNGTAIFALVASVLGFFCFMGVGGGLGVILGLIARSEIKNSDGRASGRGIANGAIALGTLNVTLTVVLFGVSIAYLVRSPTPSPPTPLLPTPFVPTPSPAPTPPAKTPPHPAQAKASRALGTEITSLGSLELADISGDFESEVETQHHAADAAGEALVLWVVERECKPCDGVAAALTNPLMQNALGKTRFVRVDRDEYQVELERLGIPTEKIPGFALLDSKNHVRDFIQGGEWDADIAVNIAPVLGKFVKGTYRKRRHAWQSAAREDETPI